jgi:diamine N-acetyltransferase
MKSIILRKIKRQDEKYFLRWWRNRQIIKYTSGIYEPSTKVLCGYFQGMLKDKLARHYLIIKFPQQALGHLAIIRRSAISGEIQIMIGLTKYWGKGYGTLALQQALNEAFGNLKYQRLTLEVRPDNLRAIALYEKCGFCRRGFKKYPDNPAQPIVLKMALTKKEWLKK